MISMAGWLLSLMCYSTAAQTQNTGDRIHSTYSVNSPDARTVVTLTAAGKLSFAVTHNGRQILETSSISVSTDSAASAGPSATAIPPSTATTAWKVVRYSQRSVDEWLHLPVPVKFSTVEDHFNEATWQFKNNSSLILRVYNNGVAYRWIVDRKGDYRIWNEGLHLQFHGTDSAWYPLEDGFYSHNERYFRPYILDSIGARQLGSLPVLINAGGTKVLFTEADLYDYAGLWLRGDNRGGLDADFPRYPREMKENGVRDRRVLSREAYVAVAKDRKELPWRVLAIADEDGDLLTNTLVYQLSRPAAGDADFSWVKSGKAAWDWWNDNNIYNVDFRAGINTATYKYYVDFAARYGLAYIILDEGWSPVGDITRVVPDLNMEELLAYARQKKVGVILWVSWLSLDKQLESALDLYQRWGIAGIKVDFIQRDDQLMINYYERVARATADRKMLVDFHGACKPTGLDRQYPNALTREGVYGNENSKWDYAGNPWGLGPEHNVTIPFTRMVAGTMDYTPGAMLNAQKEDWAAIYRNPMSEGTRCQQLAMYVVYESPLQMLCDNPTHYYKEPECMDFLSAVPTEWDSTVVLQAKVGNYVAVARKAHNGDWYIGAMTDWTPRDLSLDLSFLGGGDWRMDNWQDGINADRNAQDFKRIQGLKVSAGQTLTVHLAPGGGFAAKVRKAE